MNILYKNIKNRRLQLNMSQAELAAKLGYKDRSTIAKIESGENDITQSKIVAFAKALETTPEQLMGWIDEPENSIDLLAGKYKNIHPIKIKKVPLLGEIACGQPIYANESRDAFVLSDESLNVDFCLTCKGDSMINARIFDGDIVFIKKQPAVDNGEIAAVVIDDEATLKRVYYYKKENKLILQAENPAYAPLVYIGEELDHINILGKAVAFQSLVK